MTKTDEPGIQEVLKAIRTEIAGLRTEVGGLRTEVGGLRTEMRTGFSEVRGDIALLSAHQRDGFARVTETRIDVAEVMSRLIALEGEVKALKAGRS